MTSSYQRPKYITLAESTLGSPDFQYYAIPYAAYDEPGYKSREATQSGLREKAIAAGLSKEKLDYYAAYVNEVMPQTITSSQYNALSESQKLNPAGYYSWTEGPNYKKDKEFVGTWTESSGYSKYRAGLQEYAKANPIEYLKSRGAKITKEEAKRLSDNPWTYTPSSGVVFGKGPAPTPTPAPVLSGTPEQKIEAFKGALQAQARANVERRRVESERGRAQSILQSRSGFGGFGRPITAAERDELNKKIFAPTKAPAPLPKFRATKEDYKPENPFDVAQAQYPGDTWNKDDDVLLESLKRGDAGKSPAIDKAIQDLMKQKSAASQVRGA